MGLVQDFDEMSDTNTTARITKLMKSIITLGTGPRGQRSFEPMNFPSMFLNFSFSERVSFNSIFLAPYTSTVNGDRNKVTITIPDFNSGNLVHAPSGATHFKVINLITVLSAYSFNTTIGKYEPGDASNSQYGFDASDFIALNVNVGSVTTIVSAIDPPPTLQATSALISCIGVEFYQNVGGTQYLLSSNNAMKIQAVY
jgi:hypothetical protein